VSTRALGAGDDAGKAIGARGLSVDKTERTIVGDCVTKWQPGNSNQRDHLFSQNTFVQLVPPKPTATS